MSTPIPLDPREARAGRDEPDPGEPRVEVSQTHSHLEVDPEFLAALVRGALAAEGVRRASISVALVDDPTIQVVNRRHLDHDEPTDVISFLLSGPDDEELDGELVVSAETAARTARQAGVAPLDELALYVVHGLLHLRGHDDTTPEAARRMRRREGEVLAALGLANTFHAVAGGPDEGTEEGAS